MIVHGMLAGALVACGGICYLNNPNIIGAILFSIGLLSIILFKIPLYTGRIGYLNKENLSDMIIILCSNLLGATTVGLWYSDAVVVNVEKLVASKVGNSLYETFFLSFMCGVMIYLAVAMWKQYQSPTVVILPVVAFILCGFEHCVADMFYLAMTSFSFERLLFLIMVIIGNSCGSIVIHQALQFGYKNLDKTLDNATEV